MGALSLGLLEAVMETRVDKLWVESGGRLERETEYIDSFSPLPPPVASEFGTASTERTQQVVISVNKPDGDTSSFLTPQRLQEHLELLQTINDMKVTVQGFEFTLQDLCHKVNAPNGFGGASALIPCTRVTVLDCFSQGGFDFPALLEVVLQQPAFQFLRDDYGINGYGSRPSFHDPAVHIGAVVKEGCAGYATKIAAMHWQADLILGGITRDADGNVTSASATETILLLDSAAAAATRLGASQSVVEEAMYQWRTRFLEMVPQYSSQQSSTQSYGLASDSLDRMLQRVSSASGPLIVAGYAIMLAYVMFALLRWRSAESQAIVGLVGVLAVGLSTLAAFGLTSLLGVAFNASSTQVLPFLALGLGIDDAFVLAHTLSDVRLAQLRLPQERRMGLPGQLASTLARAGPSVTLTSCTNFVAFLCGALVPLPAVTAFCVQAAAVVGLNYVTLMLVFPAVLAAHAHFADAGVTPCGLAPTTAAAPRYTVESHVADSSDTAASHAPPFRWQHNAVDEGAAGDEGTAPADDDDAMKEVSSQSQLVVAAPNDDSSDHERNTPRNAVHPAEQSPSRSAVTQSPPSARARVSCMGRCCRYKYAPALAQGRTQAIVLVLAAGVLIVSIVGALLLEDGLDLDDVAPSDSQEASFLEARFQHFALYDAAIVVPAIDYPAQQQALLTFEATLAATAFVQAVPVSWLREFVAWVNTTASLTPQGLVPEADFYSLLKTWTTSPSSEIAAEVAGASQFGYNAKGELVLSRIPFFVSGASTVDEFVNMIDAVRGVCDATGLGLFPTGIPFTFWEQYVNLRGFLLRGLLFALGAVFIITFAVSLDVVAAALVAAVIGLTVFEVFGFMGIIGVKFSALPAVSLVMSVGIAVEFTAHLVHAYAEARQESRQARVQAALTSMGVPILNGGLSTLIGIVMLAFSPFGFVVKYFFGVYCSVVLLGLLNGLALLPVLLHFVGPNRLLSATPVVVTPTTKATSATAREVELGAVEGTGVVAGAGVAGAGASSGAGAGAGGVGIGANAIAVEKEGDDNNAADDGGSSGAAVPAHDGVDTIPLGSGTTDAVAAEPSPSGAAASSTADHAGLDGAVKQQEPASGAMPPDRVGAWQYEVQSHDAGAAGAGGAGGAATTTTSASTADVAATEGAGKGEGEGDERMEMPLAEYLEMLARQQQ